MKQSIAVAAAAAVACLVFAFDEEMNSEQMTFSRYIAKKSRVIMYTMTYCTKQPHSPLEIRCLSFFHS